MKEIVFDQEMQTAADALEEMKEFTEDEWFLARLRAVASSLHHLQILYEEALNDGAEDGFEYEDDENEEAGAEVSEKEAFSLCYTRLAGLSEQFTDLGRKRPESVCGTFKAQQANRVLLPMKELIEKDMGPALSLVSEEGEQSYSDVSLLIRGFMDLASHVARRRYGLVFDSRGREISPRAYGYGHR